MRLYEFKNGTLIVFDAFFTEPNPLLAVWLYTKFFDKKRRLKKYLKKIGKLEVLNAK